MTESKRLPQVFAAIVAASGAFAAGTVLAWTNPTEHSIKNGLYGFDVTDDEFSWVGSALPLGAAIACIPTGFIIDIIGRKLLLILLVIPFLLGWLPLIMAVQLWMLIAGRAILGVACGAICVGAPMYIGEIAQKNIRGMLGSLFQLMITLGILFVYVIGAFITLTPLTVFCAVIPVIVSFLMIFMPESPLFLIGKEKDVKAAKSFAWLRGKNYDANSEINDAKAEVAKNKAEKKSLLAPFKRPATIKGIYIGLGLMFFQQMSGINAVIFYSTDIFQSARSSLEPKFATLIIGVVQVIATVLAVIFVDRLGRRLLLLLSAGFMAACTLIMGFYFFFKSRDVESVEDFGWLPLSCMCIFIIMFSFGFGPVPWTMMGEIFPNDAKGPASALAATCNWFLAFLVTKCFVNVKNALGEGVTFWLFSAITVLGFLFVLFLVPETKNKSLNEIQEELSKKKGDTN